MTSGPFRWPHVLTVPVRFSDLDAMGHVNNATYLTYLEQARNECYLALHGRTDPLEPGAGLDFVVARAEVDYLLPVTHGDALEVRITPESIGRSSFVLTYEVRRRDGEVALRARTVQVTYDWETARSKPLTAELVDALRLGLDEDSPEKA